MSPSTRSLPVGARDAGGLMSDYLLYVEELSCSAQAKRLRRVAARRFLERFDNLDLWMRRSTAARSVDLDRTKAWSFVTWCIIEGRIKADLDLLATRTGSHFVAWADRHPDQVAAALETARQLSWKPAWALQVGRSQLALVCMTMGVGLSDLDREVLDSFYELLAEAPSIGANHRRVLESRQRALVQVCFQLGMVDTADPHANSRPRSPAERAEPISQPLIRDVVAHYLVTTSATLRPSSVRDKAENLCLFFDWLADKHPEIDRLSRLDRAAVEEYLAWNHGRLSRGRRRRGEPVAVSRQHAAVATLRGFIGDLVFWEWRDAPSHQLVHRSDLPKIPMPVPRALPPLVDAALMEAVARIPDPASRCAIQILRGTGMRLGELLDLELDCLIDFQRHGTWLRVPIGKLNTERTVPLDDATLSAFDEWVALRGRQRPITHPRTNKPANFLFMISGRQMGAGRIRKGLATAVEIAGLLDQSGRPLHVTPHQLRHTYGTTLINGGMSLHVLMALLGHVTPEMTLRYAHLASGTVKEAYDEAMHRMAPRHLVPLAGPSAYSVPERVEWVHSEMLKTRLASGYCSRHPAAGPCQYANVCETCENFSPAPIFQGALRNQLADVVELRDDARDRGWTAEMERHQRVIDSIEGHLRRLEKLPRSETFP